MLLPGLLPAEPPRALTETRHVAGYRNPQWVARALSADETPAVQLTLASIEDRLQPARDERVLYHVGRLLSHWSQKKGVDQDSILDDFATDLTGYSEAHIMEACAQWRRKHSYRPVPADLIAILTPLRGQEMAWRRRARVLLGLEEPMAWERIEPPEDPSQYLTAEQKEAIRRRILGQQSDQAQESQ